MEPLIIEPTAQSTWHRLVTEAADSAGQKLDEACESYLVFLLMRYLQKPEMVKTVLALHFLKGLRKQGRVRQEHMQDVGDQCLIFAGLFPEQAEKRLVSIDYFVKLGRSAYSVVADHASKGWASLYRSLSETFVILADVLHATRSNPGSMLAMVERYARTGSLYAKARVEQEHNVTVIPHRDSFKH